MEEIRSQEDPPNSDDDTDSESSNSSHGDASDQSSSSSETDEATQAAAAEGAPTGETASQPQVEAPQATEEDAEIEEDFHDETGGDAQPLSPATTANNELLDHTDWSNTLPSAIPNRVTDGISGLQINSPRPEVETPD